VGLSITQRARASRAVLIRVAATGLMPALILGLVLMASPPAWSRPEGSTQREGPLQAPFATPLPWLLPEEASEILLEGAVTFDEAPPFGGGAAGRLDRSRGALACGIDAGLGDRVEGSIRFGLQETWNGEEPSGLSAADVRVGVGYALRGRFDSRRALTARLAAKAPTAPDRDGLGTDEADLGIALLAGTRSERSGLFGAVGLDLLGNPRRNGSQDDVATYGAGIWFRGREDWDLTLEAEGRAFSRFSNASAAARAGTRLIRRQRGGGRLAAYISVLRGLNADSPRWGFILGASFLAPPRGGA